MASEKAKQLAAEQKAAAQAEKLRKKNSTDPKDWSRTKQVVEAYKQTAKVDKSTTPWMIGAAVAAIAVIALIAWPLQVQWWAWIPLALVSAILAALFVLTNRAKRATFTKYAGQPGSAEVALQGLNKKKYDYQIAIAATRQLDLVHRVVGDSGIVLIGEGQPSRVRPLLASEAKRHEQVAYGVTVTQLMMGDGANQVKLTDLQKHIEKLPKAIQPHMREQVLNRLRALDAVRPKAPVPRGPMPTPKGVKRAMRGR